MIDRSRVLEADKIAGFISNIKNSYHRPLHVTSLECVFLLLQCMSLSQGLTSSQISYIIINRAIFYMTTSLLFWYSQWENITYYLFTYFWVWVQSISTVLSQIVYHIF